MKRDALLNVLHTRKGPHGWPARHYTVERALRTGRATLLSRLLSRAREMLGQNLLVRRLTLAARL